MPEWLEQAREAIESGDRALGASILAQGLQSEPQHIAGWWLLSQILDNEQRVRQCLERVVALDPSHEGAQRRLLELTSDIPFIRQQHPSITDPTSGHGESPNLNSNPEPPEASIPNPDITMRRPWRELLGGLLGVLFVGSLVLLAIYKGYLDEIALDLFGRGRPISMPVISTPAIMLPSAWTLTPTIPTPSPSLTPVPSPTATFGPGDFPIELVEIVKQARHHMESEQYAEAILLWDEILDQVEDIGWIYFARAECYYELTSNQRSVQEYESYLISALEDIDRVIAVEPMVYGEYYALRSDIYLALAGITPLRIDYDRFIEIALENNQIAAALPNSYRFIDWEIPEKKVLLGRCDEALQETVELMEREGYDRGGLKYVMARVYMCSGQYNLALSFIDGAIECCSTSYRKYIRAVTLYYLGRRSDALDALNEMIVESPHYAGYRYILRGIIHLELGNLEQAEMDLRQGQANSWGGYGLDAYLEGMLALEQGYQSLAIEYLQWAEATIGSPYELTLIKLRAKLSEMGISWLVPDTQIQLTVTPNPTPPPTQIVITAPGRNPTPSAQEQVSILDGSGGFTIYPDDFVVFQFVIPEEIPASRIVDLKIHVLGTGQPADPIMTANFWLPTQEWISLPIGWGDTAIGSPALLIHPDKTIMLGVKNTGSPVVYILNLGPVLLVTGEDGTDEWIGISDGN